MFLQHRATGIASHLPGVISYTALSSKRTRSGPPPPLPSKPSTVEALRRCWKLETSCIVHERDRGPISERTTTEEDAILDHRHKLENTWQRPENWLSLFGYGSVWERQSECVWAWVCIEFYDWSAMKYTNNLYSPKKPTENGVRPIRRWDKCGIFGSAFYMSVLLHITASYTSLRLIHQCV